MIIPDERNFTIFPNPAQNELFLDPISKDASEFSALIYNVNGRLVKTIERLNGNVRSQMNISGLKTGLYVLQIQPENSIS